MANWITTFRIMLVLVLVRLIYRLSSARPLGFELGPTFRYNGGLGGGKWEMSDHMMNADWVRTSKGNKKLLNVNQSGWASVRRQG